MTTREILLSIRRTLRPVVDGLRLNAIARPVWAALWGRGTDDLVRAQLNDRVWRLHPDVVMWGDYEPDTLRWLRSTIKPGMTVIDVGANIGLITLEMAYLVGPTGKVYAIEPAPGNLALLKRHVMENEYSGRVTVIEAACCAVHGGVIDLDVYGEGDKIGSGFQITGLVRNPLNRSARVISVRVPTVSLDKFCEEKALVPGVIKIDVEGAEVDVFKGAQQLLAKAKPAIIFGFHPFAFTSVPEAQQQILSVLQTAGLRLDPSAPASWTLAEYTAK